MDEWFAEIGRRSPSFAGLYRQGDGVVLLTSNVADGPSNLQAIRDVDGGRLFNSPWVYVTFDVGGDVGNLSVTY